MNAASDMERRKRAELASNAGAGLIGAGLGVLLATLLAPFALVVLGIGITLHSWGMYAKHRLDSAEALPAWAKTLYWLCWAVLAGLAVWFAAMVLRGDA